MGTPESLPENRNGGVPRQRGTNGNGSHRNDGTEIPAQRNVSGPAPVGENLARIRRARGFTQEGLAAAAQVSVDVIARLEQGRKQTARWHTLAQLAAALDVELSTLVAPRVGLAAHAAQSDVDGGRLLLVRQALTSLCDIPGLDDFAETLEVVNLDQLANDLSEAWRNYQNGEFSLVAALLPGLIVDARRAAGSYEGIKRARAYTLLATACHMAAGITVMLGHEDLAFLAVERGIRAAESGEGELPVAAGAIFASWILLKQGRYADAEGVAVRMAERIEPSFANATRPSLATFGNLLVNASAAAVRLGHGARAAELLDVAAGAAMRHGVDEISYWSVFGPRVVEMTRTNNAVELGEMSQAVELSSAVSQNPVGEVPASWRARYALNVAFAQVEVGDDAAALDALWQAKSLASEWVLYHPLGRGITLELLQRVPRRASRRLRLLAEHFAVV